MWMLLVFLLSVNIMACEKGCEYHEGVCACDQAPVKAEETVKPSDEKPPSDKMPSYEREGVHADMPASVAAKDAISDAEKMKADQEGKKEAGIK